MERHIVKILSTVPVTHDVRRIKVSKPEGYHFLPGQATEVSLHKPGWEEERRPFTFTGLNDWDHLEFTIKIYKDRHSVTAGISQLREGDELLLHDVWGAIQYKGEGTFIAGGAGVTPFIAIFRQLEQDGKIGGNQLIFSNKTREDVILEEEWRRMLGDRFIPTLTKVPAEGYEHRRIDEAYLKEKVGDFSRQFYICGPDPMVQQLKETLTRLTGNDKLITIEI
ncbi:flavodoxin reductase [Chitinophaga pendula]|uniref:flavodoxin reductase n=1 Tax=Chitinophaga TaxID=79328 RepID=UPI000BAF9DA9|nr:MULTISPECIES: flavodoxin reductase [Chitinophaga]ASZ15140.1 flavodoxin reductase [Chitinophaga sp. MD30]UCJ07945.1 flavodoxin reductase [Chitinophaga pendula]